jgi:hypothetical protein
MNLIKDAPIYTAVEIKALLSPCSTCGVRMFENNAEGRLVSTELKHKPDCENVRLMDAFFKSLFVGPLNER